MLPKRGKLTKLCWWHIFFVFLLAVLHGCETWSLTLREERRLRLFESRVSRRIFGPKSDEVRGEWRKIHNKEINDLYPSPNIVRVIKSRRKIAVHVARMGREEVHTGSWSGNLRVRDHLEDQGVDGRIILRWIFSQCGGDMEWIDPAQNRDNYRALVNAVMNLRVP